MHIAAFVPMRHSSERVKGKNYRPLAGKPLYHWVVESLLEVKAIDEVVIDTDSPVIIDDVKSAFPDVLVLLRPEHLRAGEIPMNDVLLNTAEQVEADVLLQTHSTNPFLSAETISSALERYLAGENGCDSAFGVTRLQARLWTADAKPINHDPAVLLRTQDLPPVYEENSNMYLFSGELIRSTGSRIGSNPLLYPVPAEEAWDIDEEIDWVVVESLLGRRS